MVTPVSFAALRTFVEVGRQCGIKRAAQELNVTAGAVSQQIKALEASFGIPLLDRGNREVRLSADGLRLYGKIAPAFEQIEGALQHFDNRRSNSASLVISTTPSLAACWLTPRLGRFMALHPEVEVRLETSVQLVDLSSGPVDVALRHGSGNYPGLDTSLLWKPKLIVIGSPALLRDSSLTSPADCLRYPLLQDRDRIDWSLWLEGSGVAPTPSAAKGPSYANDALLIEAASAGQGLAAVRDIYAAQALSAGTIIQPIGASVPTITSYYVAVPPKKLRVPKVLLFREWLLEEATRSS